MGFFDRFKKRNQNEILTLEQLINKLKDSGLSETQIREKLNTDLETGGEIFGEFRERFKADIDSENENKNYHGLSQAFENAKLWEWVGISDNEMCPDCIERHNMEPQSYEKWKILGLPGSGKTACKKKCRCDLIPTGLIEKERINLDEKDLNTLEKKAQESLSCIKSDPAKVIKNVEPYCLKLMKTIDSGKGSENLLIPFWIDKLTTAFLIKNDFQNAYNWLKLYYNHPEIYKKNIADVVLKRLEKNFKKCKTEFGIKE
ncbi:hypothetical protein JW960_21645 [candidate division KSB1 bacterium]|nr:hypothetical protein [candidate division KSB1 bacterium]